nr:hypothetical protein [Acetobacter fallax]
MAKAQFSILFGEALRARHRLINSMNNAARTKFLTNLLISR